MNYVDIESAIRADGLRIVLVQGFPSPWGQAAKAMIEYKGIPYLAAPQEAMGANAGLVAWAGTNSGPVVAWNRETPVNRWNDILTLLERLAPEKRLVPEASLLRVECFGIAHVICGQVGFGWNRRLDMVRPAMESGQPPEPTRILAEKYGYNERDARIANERVISVLHYLAEKLKAQQARGSEYLVGDDVTAADFYWAAFSNLVAIQSPEDCPLDPAVRPMFEKTPPTLVAATDPILIEHRDRIMHRYFKLPMEM